MQSHAGEIETSAGSASPDDVTPATGASGSFLRRVARGTPLGRCLLLPVRLWHMLRVTLPPVGRGLLWTLRSREHYNYTYDLTPRNLRHLAAFLSVVTGCDPVRIQGYLSEIGEDETLKRQIADLNRTSAEKYVADREVRFGRRVGWYALVRARKPRLVVETGVDKGLGSVVIASALLRNAAEGCPGELIGIDINPRAGYLFAGPYTKAGTLVFQDSLQALNELARPVDLFIHDSDHSPEFEAAEYQAVRPHLAADAWVLSDNAEYTDKLMDFAAATGRKFLFFSERPRHHWWPGEGMAVAY